MKRIYYVLSVLIILIVSFLGITYSLEYQESDNLVFELVGPTTLYINVGEEYQEYGIKVYASGSDISDKVEIDSKEVNTTKIGEYKVKYQVYNEYVFRNVLVIDRIAPEIKLLGGEEIYLLLGGKYSEPGYTVSDNYDTDMKDKVKVTGSVNTNKEGEYLLTYTALDDSGNKSEVTRKVIVKKAVISVVPDKGSRVGYSTYNATLYSNTLTKSSFNNDGVYFEGYVRVYASSYIIKLKNRNNKLIYTYNMNTSRANYYSGNLNLTTVNNGVYDVYISGNSEERLISKLDVYNRIVRAKVGDKLVTFSYDDDLVTITIEDFKYQYDFVIDPGHGGSDTGTANGIMIEKDLNLKISKYEKCRYESMGYRVYMTRYDDSLGEMLGNGGLDPLDRRGLTIGYYGAVSKVVYSNHHNGSIYEDNGGFEILAQNEMSKAKLEPELTLFNKYKKFYGIGDDRIRMYSKDYYNDQILDKSDGQVYGNKNYYSVLRIPIELFNVKNVIYEPIYMTNPNDFNWYYASGNWVQVSELKIKEYVTQIGGTYKTDNSKCL